ncbi:hypothetical protein [Mesorhizobium sp. A623]
MANTITDFGDWLDGGNVPLSGADRGYVMEAGHIVHHGEAKALINDPEVRRAYLGL